MYKLKKCTLSIVLLKRGGLIMNYPVTCVWEVTMACNMRCKHCGSSCSSALPGELSTAEAFKFIDMCKDINLKWINLSGGEPFVRPDLILLIKYLYANSIPINIISNGWLVSEDIAKELAGIKYLRVMISLDGPEEIHDFIRKPGSFARIKNSLEILNKYNILTGCITTLTKQNYKFLEEIRTFLAKMNVECWQVQLGLPMGNLSENKDWILEPKDLTGIIDYLYEKKGKDGVHIFPADCMGYYNAKIDGILSEAYGEKVGSWRGCNAGVSSFGLLHDGDIVGCTSIRDKKYVEGNIKNQTLREIWENPNSFTWRRNFKPQDLSGNCKKCEHASECLGGCFNTRFTMNNSFCSENKYCTYNLMMDKK